MRRSPPFLLLAVVGAACSSSSSAAPDGEDADAAQTDGAPAPDGPAPDGFVTPADAKGDDTSSGTKGIASRYPGDLGIEKDPDVVFAENFEEGSVAALTTRYEDKKPGGITLAADVPPKSSGKASGKFYADPSEPAADLFKKLPPGLDELWVRYYAKYQKGIRWHHTGVWIGGYDPPSDFPSPQAGLKPNGDDRFIVAFEPIGADGSPQPRMDFYNYWMQMHSWMPSPSGSMAYYGNAIIHKKSVIAPDDTWFCAEIHIKLNPNPASAAGAELDLWINGTAVAHFDDKDPVGCWIRDKFCAVGSDGSECDYPDLCAKPYVPLDLRFRSTATLQLNSFWPQNYVTEGPGGSVEYDDMVVAKSFIGCIQ